MGLLGFWKKGLGKHWHGNSKSKDRECRRISKGSERQKLLLYDWLTETMCQIGAEKEISADR